MKTLLATSTSDPRITFLYLSPAKMLSVKKSSQMAVCALIPVFDPILVSYHGISSYISNSKRSWSTYV